MVHGESPLSHHFLKIPIRELIFAIPADAQKDDCGLGVAPLERRLRMLQEYDPGRVDGLARVQIIAQG
jgi:hypothetical protein